MVISVKSSGVIGNELSDVTCSAITVRNGREELSNLNTIYPTQMIVIIGACTTRAHARSRVEIRDAITRFLYIK